MAEPYKVYFHWKNDSSGKLKEVSCSEENIPGEHGFLAHLSHFFESFKGGVQAAGLTVNQPNTLQLKGGGFLYMDVGCWLHNKQTFGLICGQDAAVCSFRDPDPRGKTASGGGKSLLDQFLQLPDVKFVFREKIRSPQPSDQRLYLILPDMHVPDTPPKSLKPAHKLSKRDLFNSRDSIPAMIDFLALVRGFGHASQITLVQLGDMYELWAGRECEFMPASPDKPGITMKKPSSAEEVGEWIGETHQRWPKLFQAFDQCRDTGIEMLFLHGNHDNYLDPLANYKPDPKGSPNVVVAANVAAAANAYIQANPTQSGPSSTVYSRQIEIDKDGIFIEHGQRCDPYNRDGAMAGFNNANLAADLFFLPFLKELGSTERAMYVVGASAMWCVKTRDFGVYVMGHTHEANLTKVEVYHQREGTEHVLGPDGVTVEEKKTETPLEGTE